MRSSLLCLLLSFLCLALALSGLPTVSARNSFLRTHWASSKAVPANTLHRLRFGLKQQNTEQLKAFVERVSDPQHEQYGQYMTLQEIAEWIAPSDEKLAQFESILYKAGALNVTITQSRDFASVLLPVKSIQRLFQTPAGTKLHLHTHTHVHSGRNVLRTRHGAEFVMVPELEEHVELVTGLSDFFDFPSERKAAKAAANLRAQEASFHAKEKGQLNACSNSAPDFGRIKNSHEDVLVSVIIYCQNGHTTGDVSSPCADFPPAAQSITLRLIPRAHPMQVVQMNVNQLDCQINAASQVECTVRTQIDNPMFPPAIACFYRISLLFVSILPFFLSLFLVSKAGLPCLGSHAHRCSSDLCRLVYFDDRYLWFRFRTLTIRYARYDP